MSEKSSRVARRILSAGGALGAVLAFGSSCSRQTVTVQLHPLQASGDVSYVCRTPEGDPRPLVDCNPAAIQRGELDLYALVTQTATGEVAVINVPNDPANIHSGEGIVDVDPTVPGYGFLHVGALPGRIVSTPGSSLSVVGVAEAGKPGLFGLPTQCIGAPRVNDSTPAGTDRDLTSWPACSLPVAPGSMAVVVVPESDTLCNGNPSPRGESSLTPEQQREQCFAAVGTKEGEGGPKGRRKIVVTLPERGSIAVIDAAWLAQGTPGDFSPCLIEAELALSTSISSSPAQVLPDDLSGVNECPARGAPVTGSFTSQPAGIALDKTTLYVADSAAPLIHVVDLSNACAPVEKDPLLTRSLDRPDRLVTTSRVAVSPLTPSGRQFVYAIDQYDTPSASIMAFDVSPGATDRTPIVRPNAPMILGEPPDRIQFPSAPRDVQFFERDRPVVDKTTTGNLVEGIACDPTPDNQGIGREYRSNADYTSGARAVELRGVFGAALLTSGQVAVIDVEDFDAPCRRPRTTNTDSIEDFRGCKGDPVLPNAEPDARPPKPGVFVEGTTSTVTDEVSCRMVEPHRARASSLGLTDASRGIHAPSLRGFPQLRMPDEAQQYAAEDKPKLLAVDFSLLPATQTPALTDPGQAQVFVGTGYYSSRSTENPLEVAPASAQRNSVALPFNEPRAYPATDTLSLVYEGPLTEVLPAGFVRSNDPSSPFTAPGLTLHDPSVAFCDRGVYDEDLMTQVAAERVGVPAAQVSEFAKQHADYVVLMDKFPDADDAYWKGVDTSTCDRKACIQSFGDYDPAVPNKAPNDEREFRIVDALHQWLQLEPRNIDPEARAAAAKKAAIDAKKTAQEVAQAEADARAQAESEIEDLKTKAECCFPSGASYLIRASQQWVLRGSSSGARNRVRADWVHSLPDDPNAKYKGDQLDCRLDCNPRKRYFESRVFEICTSGAPAVGGNCPDSQTFCQIADPTRGVTAGETAESCVYSTPTARFGIYRGAKPSVRDMTFSWQIIGGFNAMRIDFSALSTQVSPNSLVGLPQMNWLTVVDGASLGLVLLSLDNLAPMSPPLN